jgi:hypothetical protein
MYNRPIYMREGGYASSFGSGINPSFGGNGVLENIQEQVSNNGDVLKSMQGGMKVLLLRYLHKTHQLLTLTITMMVHQRLTT